MIDEVGLDPLQQLLEGPLQVAVPNVPLQDDVPHLPRPNAVPDDVDGEKVEPAVPCHPPPHILSDFQADQNTKKNSSRQKSKGGRRSKSTDSSKGNLDEENVEAAIPSHSTAHISSDFQADQNNKKNSSRPKSKGGRQSKSTDTNKINLDGEKVEAVEPCHTSGHISSNFKEDQNNKKNSSRPKSKGGRRTKSTDSNKGDLEGEKVEAAAPCHTSDHISSEFKADQSNKKNSSRPKSKGGRRSKSLDANKGILICLKRLFIHK